MIRKIYKTVTVIIYSIIILILLFFSIYLVKRLTNKNGITQVLGISFFEVATGSMSPEIEVGDLVVIMKKDDKHYDEGMIITFLQEGAKTPVTHKIIKRDGNTLITKGIANNTEDTPIDVSCVIGKEIFVWHEYYKFAEFIKSPLGIIIIFIGGITIVECFAYLSKLIEKKEQSKEDQKLKEE